MKLEVWQRNLAALCFARLMMDIGMQSASPFMPLYIQTLGIHGIAEIAKWIGLIGASSSIMMTVAQPIWGSLADRWGRKSMVIRSMISAGIIVILTGFAQTPEQILALRLTQGALSGSLGATSALVASLTPKHRLGFALGLTQVAFYVGGSVGPLIGGLAADTFGFRFAYQASGILMLIGGATVICFVKENFTPSKSTSSSSNLLIESRSLLAVTMFPVVLGVLFMVQLGGSIANPIFSLYVSELNGPENAATVAGAVLACTAVLSAVAAVMVGRYSDRIGRSTVLLVCLAGAGLSYLPQAFVQTVWQLLGLRLVLGLCLGGLIPTTNALIAELVPAERRGVAFGLSTGTTSLASAVGPMTGAGITAAWGIRALFLVTGTLFAIALSWVGFVFRRGSARRLLRPSVAED